MVYSKNTVMVSTFNIITSTSYGDPDGVGLFKKCPFAENFEEYLY